MHQGTASIICCYQSTTAGKQTLDQTQWCRSAYSLHDHAAEGSMRGLFWRQHGPEGSTINSARRHAVTSHSDNDTSNSTVAIVERRVAGIPLVYSSLGTQQAPSSLRKPLYRMSNGLSHHRAVPKRAQQRIHVDSNPRTRPVHTSYNAVLLP
jgi:hypothetical protein